MNPHDSKFILRARRPGGSDADDPIFAEALAATERDPQLKAWHEREQRTDAALSAKLREIAPPPDLKAAILAGARASVPRPAWWRRPGWLAAAAAFAVLMSLVVPRLTRPALPQGDSIAEFALRDLVTAHRDHEGRPPQLKAVQAQLAGLAASFSETLDLDLEMLRRQSCRTVQFGGRNVFELCFRRDGVWYHLYVAAAKESEGDLRMQVAGSYAAASWSRGTVAYVLVSGGGREAVQRLL